MDKFNEGERIDTARLEKLFLEKGTLKVLKKNEYMVCQNDKMLLKKLEVKPVVEV
ncbi:hypothetical protein H8784_04975 [Parabacteroides acidifaciens]|uniref:Uncharacterized protein n=1 Tax=Parabacteroides acidifaciens TaxID=2290935 RepID=A0ABR7NY99_9BACT|nr:hypothetical protein [Parabacteroides acidifaciens]MBC8601072.1 hypothetical protein [Parabacteroides acidifaciens]